MVEIVLCSHRKLFNFEIQKCGQILCAHKTHFLMHITVASFTALQLFSAYNLVT